MTWEWVVLMSVLSVCALSIYSQKQKERPDLDESVAKLNEAVAGLKVRMMNAEIAREQIEKISDDAKKALSELQLAKSVRSIR